MRELDHAKVSAAHPDDVQKAESVGNFLKNLSETRC